MKGQLPAKAKSGAIHPSSLPPMGENPLEVDNTRWPRRWQEAANGRVMRAAVHALILGKAGKTILGTLEGYHLRKTTGGTNANIPART